MCWPSCGRMSNQPYSPSLIGKGLFCSIPRTVASFHPFSLGDLSGSLASGGRLQQLGGPLAGIRLQLCGEILSRRALTYEKGLTTSGAILEIAISRNARATNCFTSGRSFSVLFKSGKRSDPKTLRTCAQRVLRWKSSRSPRQPASFRLRSLDRVPNSSMIDPTKVLRTILRCTLIYPQWETVKRTSMICALPPKLFGFAILIGAHVLSLRYSCATLTY